MGKIKDMVTDFEQAQFGVTEALSHFYDISRRLATQSNSVKFEDDLLAFAKEVMKMREKIDAFDITSRMDV